MLVGSEVNFDEGNNAIEKLNRYKILRYERVRTCNPILYLLSRFLTAFSLYFLIARFTGSLRWNAL